MSALVFVARSAYNVHTLDSSPYDTLKQVGFLCWIVQKLIQSERGLLKYCDMTSPSDRAYFILLRKQNRFNFVGLDVGLPVGVEVGCPVGCDEGSDDGCPDGWLEGCADG